MKATKQKHFYHFTSSVLRDGSPLPPRGHWLRHKGPLVPCESGLHMSAHPFDALNYAPGPMLHLVRAGTRVVPHGEPVDKFVSNGRLIVCTIDATSLLRQFARRVAQDVLRFWPDAPEIVKQYLETGDESIRAAARAAAWDAACAAAWDAACAAAWAAAWAAARDAAWDAAGAAAWDAARAAARAAARDAARAAAWAAAWDAACAKYREWFKTEVEAAFEALKRKEKRK